jgi:hypothetical protein
VPEAHIIGAAAIIVDSAIAVANNVSQPINEILSEVLFAGDGVAQKMPRNSGPNRFS